MVGGCTAVHPLVRARSFFFFKPFRLPAVFDLFLPYNTHVHARLRHPIHSVVIGFDLGFYACLVQIP